MEVYIFTIRNKKTKELIFAEGSQHDEYYSFFELEKHWINENELSGAWEESRNKYSYNEEIRHLINSDFEKVVFNLETIDFN